MRALIVDPGPNFSVQDVADGWESGLKSHGVEVQRFDTGGAMTYHERALQGMGVENTSDGQLAARMAASDLEAMTYRWWPDLILIVSSFFVPKETYRIWRSRGHKIVTVCTESPYEDDTQIKLGHWCDVLLTNDPQNLERFREINPASFYTPHAFDPAIHSRRPAQEQYRSDAVFVGTGYRSRIEFLESCNWDGIDLALAGNWGELQPDSPLRKYLAIDDARICCENKDETVELYSSTQVAFNIYRTEAQHPDLAQGWAMGPREVELAACETFYLTQARGENRAVLPMIPTFTDAADLSEKIRYWLPRESERAQIAADAHGAIADRTFANHAGQLLARL